MTLAVPTVRQLYNGNDSTTTFAIPFAFTANDEVEVVTVVTATGVETPRAYTTYYTIVGSNVETNSAVPSGTALLIRQDKDIEQQIADFSNQTTFLPTTLEEAIDYIVSIEAQLNERINRCITLPKTTTLSSIEFPRLLSGKAGYVPSVNTGETAFEYSVTVDTIQDAIDAGVAAAASASSASASASSASTSASAASTSASAAAASAVAAAASASTASTQATNAASSASTASTQASNAATSASNASTSETNAASSASTASTQASNASTSASNASTSATNASNSATTASTQATNASTSATNAATSETNAAASAVAAAASAVAAAAAVTYVVEGTHASPEVQTDGGTVTVTVANKRVKVYVAGSGGATKTPTNITAGTTDGQELLVVGTSDTNTVTMDTGGNIITKGTMILADYDVAIFNWDHASTKWFEVSRSA